MKTRKQSLAFLSWFFLFCTVSVYAYTLSHTQRVNINLAGNKIISVSQENWMEKSDLVGLINTFQIQREFSDKQQAILDQLLSFIQTTRVSEAPAWSIQEMKEKIFVWSDLVLEEVLASNSAYTRYRISYNSNGLSISGIMNIPTGDWPYPLVILNHGYIDPAVYTVGRGLKREQDYLARNGYVVLHTDYRNHWLSDDSTDLNQNYYFRSYFYGTDSINAINAVEE